MTCGRCGKVTNSRYCFICRLAYENGISKITQGIYLTDNINARDYEILHKLGVKQILTVGIDLDPHRTNVFKTYKIDVSDVNNENISMYFNTANEFIKKDVTLVHCRAGISRSATIVIAYLMKTNRWNLSRALSYVRGKRRIIKPNDGFIEQLKKYESLCRMERC